MPTIVEFSRHPAPPYNSNFLNSQGGEEIIVADSNTLSDDVDMPQRIEIKARLRQLPEVIGMTDGDICKVLGIESSAWANYKSERMGVTIRPDIALALWNAFGIPMEWVYGGQTNLIADPVLRAKLSMANRRAEAWLASRPRPKGGTIGRIALMVAVGVSLLLGPPEAGRAWKRIGDAPIAAQRYEGDRLACRGEARDHVEHQLANEDDYAAIYLGCMAEKGYLPDGNWYKP